MSDEPRDGTAEGSHLGSDDPAAHGSSPSVPAVDPPPVPSPAVDASPDGVSAPWERPRRWGQGALDPTRVDDLLARLGNSNDAPAEGRRRRRAADDAVPANELIAALSANQNEEGTPAAPPDNNDDNKKVAPPTDKQPEKVAATATSADAADQTAGLPARIGPNEKAPIRDLGDDPRTDFIPKLTGNAAERAEADSIRQSLSRQSRIDAGPAVFAGSVPGGPPPAHPDTHTVHPSGRPRRRHSGWIYAGRSIAAAVALITLLGVGVEWKIKDRADTGLEQNSVAAINLADPHISSARTAPSVMTNSAGVTTTEAAKPPTTYAPENILLLGSDTRSGSNGAIGGTDQSTDGTANSDTLMVAHISGDRQHVTILSIPRDTIIPAPSCKVWNSSTGKVSDQNNDISPGQTYHINSAYSVGGPLCTVTAVQSLTGLGINRMIGIDFSGFEGMVNALGGITVDVCRPIVDTVLGTVMAHGGVQKITGAQAIQLVRARDVIGDTESDLARIRRQQVVLSAILRQVTQAGTLLNPSKLDNFLQAFVKNTFTNNVKLEDLVTLAGSLGSLDPAHVTFYTLPTVPSTTIAGALDVDKSKAAVVFDDLVNDLPLPGESAPPTTKVVSTPSTPAPTTAVAPSLKLTVDPSKVDLEIYNVSGHSNVATTTQQKLNGVGFDVSADQLYKPDSGAQTGTTVLYAPANRAAALTVAAAVPGSTLVVRPGLGSTVRLMVGSSFGGTVDKVIVGAQAPASLATAISTGPSISTTTPNQTPGTLASTALSSVNAGAGTCA